MNPSHERLTVILGLDPRIHAFMDCPVKPGNDTPRGQFVEEWA